MKRKKTLKSPTLDAVQQEFFSKNHITVPQKVEDKNIVVERPQRTDGIEYGLKSGKDFGEYIAGINKLKPLVFMKDEDIVRNILAHYDTVLNTIILPEYKDDALKIQSYLKDNNCDMGICKYARKNLGVDICANDFVSQYFPKDVYDLFWFDPPSLYFKAEDKIKSISSRVERLTEILNSFQDEQ